MSWISVETRILVVNRHNPEMQLRNFCRMIFIDGSLNSSLKPRLDQVPLLPQRRGFHADSAANGAAGAHERGGMPCVC